MPQEFDINTAMRDHLAQAQAIREASPFTAVERGAFIEPPKPMTQLELDEEGSRFLDKAMGGLKFGGQTLLRPLTFAVEQLERTQDVFQATVLTVAGGRIPIKEYPRYIREITSGQRKISGKEFMTIAFGENMWDQLSHINAIPGWTKEIMTPEVHLAGGPKSKAVPKLSLAQVLGASAEIFIDPLFVAALVPKAFFTTTKLGRLAAKAGLDPATSPLTFPLRKTAALVTGRSIPGLGPLLYHGRDPVSAGLPVAVTDAMQLGGKALEDAGDFWGRRMIDIVKRHKPRKGFLGVKLGPRGGLDEAAQARVYKKLFQDPTMKLRKAEQALVDDLLEEVIRPLHKRMAAMEYDRFDVIDQVDTVIRNTVGFSGTKQKVGLTRTIVWNPEKDLLSKFHGTPKNFRLPVSEIGTPSFSEKMRVSLGWKRPGVKVPFDEKRLHTSNMDPFHAVEQWIETVERKLILEERVRKGRNGWSSRGLVNKFRPPSENAKEVLKGGKAAAGTGAGALREMARDKQKWKYYINKMHDFTGHRAGKLELSIQNGMIHFMDGVNKNIAKAGRKHRIVKYVLKKTRGRTDAAGLPRMPKIEAIAGAMTANTVIATLGGNLSSAIKNTSQLINTVGVNGLPATLRGMYRMADFWSTEGKTLRQLRKSANFNNSYRRLINDSSWTRSGRTTFDNAVMGPFNAVEMHMRGISFNIAVSRELEKQGVRNLKGLSKFAKSGVGFNQASPKIRKLMELGIKEAHDTNFIYGIAGRSHFMMNPVARVGFALQSFSWKQAEFISRAWQRDGSALMRLIGLNGWVIEQADRLAGINAENWLGWGFLPPSSLGRGPAMDALSNVVQMGMALNDDDNDAFEKATNRMRGSVREIFRAFGDPDVGGPGFQAALSSAAIAGLMPLPIVGVGRTFKALNEFTTGIRESKGGKTWQHVTPQEAARSWFFTTHRQMEDARFAKMEQQLRKSVDSALDKRISSYMKALRGTDGEEVMAAAALLASPINIPGVVTGNRAGLGLPGGKVFGVQQIAAFFRLGDDQTWWPHPGMIETRINNQIRNRTLSRDVVEMIEAGWTMELYWSQYINRAMQELDRGAILPLNAPR